MKNISKTLKQKREYGGYKLPEKYFGHRTFEEFLDLNNIDEPTDKDIRYYYELNFNDFCERSHESYIWNINETLKSHPHEKLIDKIKKTFDVIDVYAGEDENKNSKALPVFMWVDQQNPFVWYDIYNTKVSAEENYDNKLKKTKEAEKLHDILDFFNYYISIITCTQLGAYCIGLEPKYTTDISKEIKNNGGHVYHITNKKNLNSIMNTGLRPRVGKTPKHGGYRYFVERVYLIGDNKTRQETVDNIKNVMRNKQMSDDYVILDIDISKHNIGLWEDGASSNAYDVYTYEAIPPALIVRVVDDIENI